MKKLLSIALGTVVTISSALAQSITVVTEEAFPFSYLSGGEVKGVGTALVEATLKQARLGYKIDLYPWARAVSMATTEPNVLIYSIARTPERETKFKWVGEIAPLQYSLYKLKSRGDISINQLDDARKFRIGIVKDDLRSKYLIERGFKPGSNLEEVSNNTLNLRKLDHGRIDLVPISLAALESMCNTGEFECAKYERAFDLDLRIHLYMAFSLETPDEVVERARRSYNSLRAAGMVAKILPRFWPD